MKPELIAPCGINCGVCYAHLREKRKCPGCRNLTGEIQVSISRCKIRTCPQVSGGQVKYCYECDDFPCAGLKALDKRYRQKYDMSEIENLRDIRDNGIRKFLAKEKERYTCPACGGVVCVHTKSCNKCLDGQGIGR